MVDSLMAEYTETINTTYNIPNITVYNLYRDSEHYAFRVEANTGYVMYDTTEENYIIDPETEEEIPIAYYYRDCHIPVTRPNEPYNWCAVLESEAPSDCIFNNGNNHEVM